MNAAIVAASSQSPPPSPPAGGGIAGDSKVFLVPAALGKSGWTSPPPLLMAMTPTASTADERASAAVSPAWRASSSNIPFHPPAPLWSPAGSGIPARNSRPPPPLSQTRSPEPNPRLSHAAAAACISEALSDLPGRPLLLLLLPLGSCGRWYTCCCCCSQTCLGALRSQAKPPPSAPSRSSKSPPPPPPPPLLPLLRLPTGSYIGGRAGG
ncbi:unnamed protein product [Ectocarpus sp. 6 AP-2014]